MLNLTKVPHNLVHTLDADGPTVQSIRLLHVQVQVQVHTDDPDNPGEIIVSTNWLEGKWTEILGLLGRA